MSVSGLVAAAAEVAVVVAESWVAVVVESAVTAAGPWVAERTVVGGPAG